MLASSALAAATFAAIISSSIRRWLSWRRAKPMRDTVPSAASTTVRSGSSRSSAPRRSRAALSAPYAP